MRRDELLDLVKFSAGDVVGVEEALHHRGQRPVEGVLEGVEQFAPLRLGPGDRGAVDRLVALFFRCEQSLDDHAIHQGADGRVGPFGAFEESLLNGRRGAGLAVPDGFDDRPLGFGEFDRFLGHG